MTRKESPEGHTKRVLNLWRTAIEGWKTKDHKESDPSRIKEHPKTMVYIQLRSPR